MHLLAFKVLFLYFHVVFSTIIHLDRPNQSINCKVKEQKQSIWNKPNMSGCIDTKKLSMIFI